MFQRAIRTRLKNKYRRFSRILARYVRHEHHAARFALRIIKINARGKRLVNQANVELALDLRVRLQAFPYSLTFF